MGGGIKQASSHRPVLMFN